MAPLVKKLIFSLSRNPRPPGPCNIKGCPNCYSHFRGNCCCVRSLVEDRLTTHERSGGVWYRKKFVEDGVKSRVKTRLKNMTATAETAFSFKPGDLVLIKWNDSMVYFAKIKKIDQRRRKCTVVFDDKSQDEADFSQIHSGR